jgi:hypothetical protein
MKKVVHTCLVATTCVLGQEDKTASRRAINVAHTGKETIPMGAEVSADLKTAHYWLNATDTLVLKCSVWSDGTKTYEIA